MAKYCINCGKKLTQNATICANCGANVKAGDSFQNQPKTTVVVSKESPKSNGFATAGFIVSLISFILCCGSFSWISLILSIVGIAMVNNYNGKGKGLAITGIILSILGIILLVVVSFILPLSIPFIAIFSEYFA